MDNKSSFLYRLGCSSERIIVVFPPDGCHERLHNKKIKQLLEIAGIDRLVPIYNEKTGENEYFPLWQRASKAVERDTNMEIRDDFALRNIAFRQKAYKVDKDLNVLE